MNEKLQKALDIKKRELSKEEEMKSLIERAENLKREISKGDKGDKGADGYTPKLYIDYFTEDDQAKIVDTLKESFRKNFAETKSQLASEMRPVKGVDYFDGVNGKDGLDGKSPTHRWIEKSVQFSNPDGTWGELVNLKGEIGPAGPAGMAPEHEISGYKVRFKNPDGTWGEWIDFGLLIQIMMPRGGGGSTSTGSSASSFLELTDTPNTYAGQALKVIQVNAGETGLEFVALAGGGDALTANPLSQFAATTSLQLKGVISDETGSGSLVFATSPTLVTPILGAATGTSLQLSGLTASQILATDASKNLVSLSVATYPSLAELAYVKGVTSAIQTQIDGKQPLDADLTTLASVFSSASAAGPASLALHEDTDNGTNKVTIIAPASMAADRTLTLPDATDTLVGKATTDTLTNKSIDLASNTITTTKAQLDTAVSDGNIMFDGDSITNATATAWRIFYSDGSGVITELALGADGTFLKSNGAAVAPSFATPAGSGNVSKVGTPVDNQIGVWTGDGTLEGDANLTWDGTSFNIATAKNFQIAGATILADAAGTTTLSNIDALDATTEATIEAAIDTLANLTSIQGRTVTLADAGANAIFGWDDVAGAYENLSQAEVLAVVGDSTATAKGVVELATDAETVTGTDTARATTPANITARLAAPGTIGGTTPGAATFTTVTATTINGFTTGGNITLAENTSIDLDPAGSADGKYTGIAVTGTAGEALAFGDVIVLDVTAGKWFKGSVSAAAGADGDLRGGVGMCVLAAAGDASATKILLMGTCRADANFPALTIGSVVYATTSGDITVTQPSTTDHIIKVLGYALTADEIMFCPSMDYMTHV